MKNNEEVINLVINTPNNEKSRTKTMLSSRNSPLLLNSDWYITKVNHNLTNVDQVTYPLEGLKSDSAKSSIENVSYSNILDVKHFRQWS